MQANEAKSRLVDDHDKINIENSDNDVDFNDVMLGDAIVNATNKSNMQLESLLPEIDNCGEEFLWCGKSSIKLDEHVCTSDAISNNDIDFTIDVDESNDHDQLATKSNLHSFVASSEQY